MQTLRQTVFMKLRTACVRYLPVLHWASARPALASGSPVGSCVAEGCEKRCCKGFHSVQALQPSQGRCSLSGVSPACTCVQASCIHKAEEALMLDDIQQALVAQDDRAVARTITEHGAHHHVEALALLVCQTVRFLHPHPGPE